MRRPKLALPIEEALADLAEAEVIRLSTLAADGTLVVRTLHAVLFDGALWFHGSPKGEKAEAAGQPAVICVDEVLASIPSTWTDPERACPATTWYRSVQAKGRLTAVDDVEQKATMLQALMEKYQPEGGYRPISAADPLYRNAVRGIGVWKVPLDEVTGKEKHCQLKSDEDREKLLEQLWRRGAPGDVRAIERCLASEPSRPVPVRFELGGGCRLSPQLGRRDVDDVVALLRDQYWNDIWDDRSIGAAHPGSTAWVGARDGRGQIIGTARAISDGSKLAWIYDVAVAEPYQRVGLGSRLMDLLLDHPSLRGVGRVMLATVDAAPFYRRLGFEPRAHRPGSVELVLARPAPPVRATTRGLAAAAPPR